MKTKMLFLVSVSIFSIIILTAGCASGPRFAQKKAWPGAIDPGPTQMGKSLFRQMGLVPDLYKRDPSDTGLQSARHIQEMQAIQHGVELDVARMEAEATRVEMAKKLGIDYKPVPFTPTPRPAVSNPPAPAAPAVPSGPPPGGRSPLIQGNTVYYPTYPRAVVRAVPAQVVYRYQRYVAGY
ncbi:MAG: hypothetical protein HYV67_00500 [Candidatus Taylorbacteria bacterium]|nr:hypothetical protein [Candidatus Taylorbacteria bacterium]